MRSRRNDGARRSPGALEAEVLAVLWSSDEPQSPAEVQLSGDLAYSPAPKPTRDEKLALGPSRSSRHPG
jgi:hypothetical protein